MAVREGWAWFFFYSAFGWIIDTAFRSYLVRGYASGSLFPVPFCPIYGLGALAIFGLHVQLRHRGWLAQGIAYGLSLSALEYLAGEINLFFTGEKLWEYHGGLVNLNGFTNLEHAVLWGTLAIVLVRWLHPFVLHYKRHYAHKLAREWPALRLR